MFVDIKYSLPLTMTFNQKISAYTLGLLTVKDLSDIAMTALEEGKDSESLRMLAGQNASCNAFQVLDYFSSTLKELNMKLPDQKAALLDVLKYLVRRIVDKQSDPYPQFEKINEIVSRTEYDLEQLNLMDCYVLYICIWEVKGDGLQLQGTSMTKEEYILKTTNELVAYLSDWLNEASNGKN